MPKGQKQTYKKTRDVALRINKTVKLCVLFILSTSHFRVDHCNNDDPQRSGQRARHGIPRRHKPQPRCLSRRVWQFGHCTLTTANWLRKRSFGKFLLQHDVYSPSRADIHIAALDHAEKVLAIDHPRFIRLWLLVWRKQPWCCAYRHQSRGSCAFNCFGGRRCVELFTFGEWARFSIFFEELAKNHHNRRRY